MTGMNKNREDRQGPQAGLEASENHGTAAAPSWTLQVHDDPAHIDAKQWDALARAAGAATPFTRHAYLSALHESGSAVQKTGWSPQFLTLEREGTLVGACPLYLKAHSYGEYVFDWAWANAYERNGLPYYPKLLSAVPFTPVPGARLLAADRTVRAVLLRALQQLAEQNQLSSAHLLFIDDADRAVAEAAGWMLRSTVQFHWSNREPEPYADFAELLATLQRDKRKKIQQERRYVREAGIEFEVRLGAQISRADWDFFYRCYCSTYRAHRSQPYLTRDFFARMAETMAPHWLLFTAKRAGQPVATSLIALDPEQGHAYGRYWGALESVNCLHFEACYYQPLAWCIAHGFRRFEGGAQGEHKMARGLMPVRTHSAHWLADPRFADAVQRFLEHEGAGVESYVSELDERNPFKPTP